MPRRHDAGVAGAGLEAKPGLLLEDRDLVPGFREAQRGALAAGALGSSFSGAGPAVFAVAEEQDAPAVAASLVEGFRSKGVAAEARVCVLDRQGARILEEAP